MASRSRVTEDPWVHKKVNDKGGGDSVDAENEQGTAEQRVIIIGAGLTGLLIAHGLLKTGITFSIWEAESNFSEQRSGDWSMGIHWALPTLQNLLSPELYAKMQECHTDPFHAISDDDFSQLPIVHGVTGEILKPSSKMKMPRVSRYRMRRRLLEALPEGSVQRGKRLLEIQPGDDTVTAKFVGGDEITGTCLIGADGPRSRVRQILVGTEKGTPSSVPYIATRILVMYPTAEQALHVRSLHYLNAMAVHPDGIWAWISPTEIANPDAPETWKFQLMTSWRKTERDDSNLAISLVDIKMKYKDFAEPFRSANAWVPDGTPVYTNGITYWEPPHSWNNHGGRISLAGDAAHSMTFHRGQGLNHAITDAAKYVAALGAVISGQESLTSGIGAYESEMIVRGGEEVRLSKLNTEMVHDWDRLIQSPVFKMGTQRGA